jgi:hypothetical protein
MGPPEGSLVKSDTASVTSRQLSGVGPAVAGVAAGVTAGPPWTVDDARWFLESAWHAGETLCAAFVLILVLGLRKGALKIRRQQQDADPVAALCCCTKIKIGRSDDRNRPLSWVGDTGIEPVTSSV